MVRGWPRAPSLRRWLPVAYLRVWVRWRPCWGGPGAGPGTADWARARGHPDPWPPMTPHAPRCAYALVAPYGAYGIAARPSMISRVEVAVATTLSLASKTSAEAKATRRPGLR